MKAIVYQSYGSPAVLQFEEIDRPTLGDGEVLIKVRAASVNPLDWHFMRGTPYIIRASAGLRRPKQHRLGVDVAGQVEVAGRNVVQFKPGDEVFGLCRGAFAEYVCTFETMLVLKPENVTFEEAASVPLAGLTALQGLRDKGRLHAGEKILVNGAAGGVGTFAVQIGKAWGAEVTGVCSTKNVELVRSIGADRVIDYTQECFTKGRERYNLILDCVGNHSLLACTRVLTSNGRCVLIGGQGGRWIGPTARFGKAFVLSKFVKRKPLTLLTRRSREDLSMLSDLMRTGKLKPVIDKHYRLSSVPEAVRYLETGHSRGKVVITVQD